MRHEHRALTEIYKPWKNLLYGLCINHHGIIYSGQFLNPERYRNFGIYETRKAVNALSVLIFHGTDLYNPVML